MNIAWALCVASLAPAALVVGAVGAAIGLSSSSGDDWRFWMRPLEIGFVVAVVTAVHVVLLGLPAYLLLRWCKAVRWWSLAACGCMLGAMPFAMLAWPEQHPGSGASAIVNGVEIIRDGMTTAAGWWSYARDVGTMGAFGGFSAWVFWWMARRDRNTPPRSA